MTLTEHIFDEGIYYDTIGAPVYNKDGTVTLMLMDTQLLNTVADRIRRDAGFDPLYERGYVYAMGGYHFFLKLIPPTAKDSNPVGKEITFRLFGSRQTDTGVTYLIPLSKEERKVIKAALDRQLAKALNMDCGALLAVAEMKNEQGVFENEKS